MTTMLTQVFLQLVTRYTKDSNLANNLWLEIFTLYSDSKRHYHTTTHLENLLSELAEVKDHIQDWDTILFALYYHDAIYKSTSSTNEEESARLAQKRLKEIGYPDDRIQDCCNLILATKHHNFSEFPDVNYFTDADLSVLGKNWDVYQDYYQHVREEYNSYPDFMYSSGRKKVLENFLKMDKIFKTDYFFQKYEAQARYNIENEISQL